MTMCCGHNHSSNFCPICGQKLITGTMQQLLDHLKAHYKRVLTQNEQKRAEYEQEADFKRKEIRKRWLASSGKQAQKWKSWIDGLEDLMKRNGTQ